MRRVVLDTGTDAGDYPARLTLSTRARTACTGTTAATGTGAGQLTTIDIPATQRGTCASPTATAPATVVADVRIYR